MLLDSCFFWSKSYFVFEMVSYVKCDSKSHRQTFVWYGEFDFYQSFKFFFGFQRIIKEIFLILIDNKISNFNNTMTLQILQMFFRTQTFRWKNFQVWVLNKNSSWIGKRSYMQSQENPKNQNFQKIFFGWVIMWMSSYVEKW